MKHFILGFIVATALWSIVYYFQSSGWLENIWGDDESLKNDGANLDAGVERETAKGRTKGKRWGKKRGRRKTGFARTLGPPDEVYDTTSGVSGDNLGSPGTKELTMGAGGGEDQLSPAEIDKGIDRVFNGIQRCLVLVPPGAPATGKVIFGMHIASRGRVTKVNLRGPNTIITGEAGACLRRTAKTIRYRSFDGPDMIANYPVVFE